MKTYTYDDLTAGALPVGATVDLSTIPEITLGEAWLVEPEDPGQKVTWSERRSHTSWAFEETEEDAELIVFEPQKSDHPLPRGARVSQTIDGRRVLISNFPARKLVPGRTYRARSNCGVLTAPFFVPPLADRRDHQNRDRRFLASIARMAIPGIPRPTFVGTPVRQLEAPFGGLGLSLEIIEELRDRGALRPAQWRKREGSDG